MGLPPEPVRADLRGTCLVLVFQPRDHAKLDDDLDTDSIPIWLHVESVPFVGSARSVAQRSELRSLRSSFARLLGHVGDDREERFALSSGALSMRIHLTRLGHIEGEIEVDAYPPDGPLVRVPIHADQTYLPLWIDGIDAALEVV